MTQSKPQTTCRCPAYSFPHRQGGGRCELPYHCPSLDREDCNGCSYSEDCPLFETMQVLPQPSQSDRWGKEQRITMSFPIYCIKSANLLGGRDLIGSIRHSAMIAYSMGVPYADFVASRGTNIVVTELGEVVYGELKKEGKNAIPKKENHD